MKEVIIEDLKVAGIYDRIEELSIMDLETGRQALSFALLNAKKVKLSDLWSESFTCEKP